jgi:hypothetical protein
MPLNPNRCAVKPGRHRLQRRDMKIPEAVEKNLASGEDVLHVIRASRALSMDMTPKTLAVTNQRVILIDHKLMGRYELQDIPYSKMETVRFEQGVAGSHFTLKPEDGEAIEVAWLSRDGARKAIETIRDALDAIAVEPVSIQRTKKMLGREEWVLHKPEELVYRRGSSVDDGEKTSRSDPLEQIGRLKELLERGAISQEEYERKKRDLLDQV